MVPLATALLALPLADEVWISWHFHELCKNAGVHITRKVTVDGFLDDTSRSSSNFAKELVITDPSAIREFDRAGYQFQESLFTNGKAWHLERVPEGIQASILDRPMARSHYKFADPRQEVSVGHRLEKMEVLVIDSASSEVIGRETVFNRYPGWVEGLWVGFIGSGLTQCPDPGKGPPREHLPTAALSPNKSK